MNRHVEGGIRWGLPLLLTAGTVYAVYRVFVHVQFSERDNGWTLAGMGACYLIAAAFVVGFTRRWEMRSLGQVVTYLADAGLYLGLGLAATGHRHPFTLRDQNVVRAGFLVGGPFLVLGLLWWAACLARDWRARRKEPA
jgi:hypothetical protein